MQRQLLLRTNSLMPWLNPCYEIWGPELPSYKTPFDKSTIEQVHIKFCKQSLNVPWYTENIACGAELRRYPLRIDIKASICSYWQRLKHSTNNVLLREALISICNKKSTFLQHSTEKVESKRTSNPATHQECTISYKEKPQGSISTELA